MNRDLSDKFNVDTVTLYDKPKECFGSISAEESHLLFCKLGKSYKPFLPTDGITSEESEVNIRLKGTAFTQTGDNRNSAYFKPSRPGLLVSSTSWTEDEDFSILLDALDAYEAAVNCSDVEYELPSLVCVITGKGPQKDYYCDIISKKVRIYPDTSPLHICLQYPL